MWEGLGLPRMQEELGRCMSSGRMCAHYGRPGQGRAHTGSVGAVLAGTWWPLLSEGEVLPVGVVQVGQGAGAEGIRSSYTKMLSGSWPFSNWRPQGYRFGAGRL